jgi:hypothetical protein
MVVMPICFNKVLFAGRQNQRGGHGQDIHIYSGDIGGVLDRSILLLKNEVQKDRELSEYDDGLD